MQLRRHLLVTILVLVSALSFSRTGNATDLVPEDTCIIEVQAPPGARVTLNGKDYGTQRTITYRPLQKGELYPIKATVRLSGGKRVEKQLLLKGGWRVHVAVRDARHQTPELVPQIGHTASVRSVAFSPDGRRVVTGSGDMTAIVWDALTGRQLRTLIGHTHSVNSVAFSPDGRQVLTGSSDAKAILWDIASGTRLRTFIGHKNGINSVTFDSDGRRILTGSSDKTAILWDVNTTKQVRVFTDHRKSVRSVAFRPDGRQLLTGSWDGTAILWDAATAGRLRTLKVHKTQVSAVAFSPDGKRILTGTYDNRVLTGSPNPTAILWDAETGKKLRTFAGKSGDVTSVAFSPDGRRALTGRRSGTAILWDVETGKELRTFGRGWSSAGVTFSPDGRRVVTSSDSSAIVCDAETASVLRTFASRKHLVLFATYSSDGQQALTGSNRRAAVVWSGLSGSKGHTFKGHESIVWSGAFAPDGRQVLTGSSDDTAILWNVETGTKIRTFVGHKSSVESVAFSSDGRRILTGSSDKTALLWSTSTGAQIRTFVGHKRVVNSVAFSPDGRRVITGSSDKTAIVWDSATGRKLLTLTGHTDSVHSVSFSPDGRQVLTGSADEKSILWDAKNGTRLRIFAGSQATFSPDGRQILTALGNRTAVLWNAETAKRIRIFRGHWGSVLCTAFSPNGRHVMTGSDDGTTRLWDVATGDELCSLVSIDGGKDWLVVTPEGLFDGSEGGMKTVMFRVGNGLNVVPVGRFFQDFHREGLLARIWRGERLMPNVDVSKSIPPTVKLISPTKGGETGSPVVTLEVEVKDNGAGVKGPFLRHNGAKVGGSAKVQRIDASTARHTFTVKLLEGENRLRIEAASGDGAWESEPARIAFTFSKSLPKPDLYIVAVGINKYADDALKLSYAVPDATAISTLFSQRGSAFYEKVHVTRLLDDQATKTDIRSALRTVAAKAREQDTLLVYFSGHGFTVGQRYYFIPSDFRFASKRFQDDVEDQGLPGNQIFQAMGNSKVLKRVLVLDTCNSGAALKRSGTKKRSGFAFAGAIRRLARSQGIFTIAASSASDETAEIRELGHGVLTYSLLTGVKGVASNRKTTADGNGDGVVNISEWFGFAADEVPKLTKKYLGIQQNVQQRTEGVSFPVLPLPKH